MSFRIIPKTEKIELADNGKIISINFKKSSLNQFNNFRNKNFDIPTIEEFYTWRKSLEINNEPAIIKNEYCDNEYQFYPDE